MTDNVLQGSVVLPPVREPVLHAVRLLTEKVVAGSVCLRGETVRVDEPTALEWVAALEAEFVATETPTAVLAEEVPVEMVNEPVSLLEDVPAEPTPSRKKKSE